MNKKDQWVIEEYCNSHGLGDDGAKLFKEHFIGLLYEFTGQEKLSFYDELEAQIEDLKNQVAELETKVNNMSSENVDLTNERDALLSERRELKKEEKDGV